MPGRCCSSSRCWSLAMLVTRDMGPLLIAGYGSGAFLAATVAMWWHRRSGAAAVGLRARGRRLRALDRPRHRRAVRGRLGRQPDRDAARERRRAVRIDQRPARAGRLVPARGAGRRLRPRRGAVVRLRAGARLQRRAGADPQRLHVHRDRRRVRRAGGVGRGARLRGLAASADPPPRPRHARRAASARRAPAAACSTARHSSAGSRSPGSC